MLIDSSFFTVANLRIEGIEGDSVPALAIKDRLDSFIEKYERRFLLLVLGKGCADGLAEYVGRKDDEGFVEVEKWEDLIHVLVYKEYSPIANYVYFYFVRSSVSRVTALGVQRTDTEDKIINPNEKLCMAWNDMVGMNEDIYNWLYERRCLYGGLVLDEELLTTINEMNL